MAFRDPAKKPYIVDNNSNIKVGIDLPIRFADEKEGGFATTKTTMDAVKNNIRNLLNTHRGERIMQPQMGTTLRRIIFDQIDETTVLKIEDAILDAFQIWLPFVIVRDIQMTNDSIDTDTNKVNINIVFSIKQDPNTTDSVTLGFSSDINTAGSTNRITDSGGGY